MCGEQHSGMLNPCLNSKIAHLKNTIRNILKSLSNSVFEAFEGIKRAIFYNFLVLTYADFCKDVDDL